MARATRAKPTPMQARFIALFKTNVLSGGTKSIKDMLRDAGYDDESVRQYSNVMQGIQPHLDPFVSEMEAHRDAVMQRMKGKIDSATYGELTRALDVLTANIRLLSGKSTSNIGVIVGDRRGELDRLI